MTDTDDTHDSSDQQSLDVQAISQMAQRAAVAAAMGQSWGYLDDREYFDTLGYPARGELGIEDYRAKFERGGIAETIITAVSGQTWAERPTIVDDGSPDDPDEQSGFEDDVATLFDDHKTLHYLERADTLQRIGRYGILLIGFNDGGDLEDPVNTEALTGDPSDDILYFQPFGEDQIQDFEREDNHQDERFGKPATYEVDFGSDHPLGTETVHHDRVIHIAEGALEDEVIGYSAYRPVFNLLVDLLKVVGGSAEMYWRDAKSRYVAKKDDGAGAIQNEEKVATQIEELANDLRDVAWLDNATLERLEGSSPDPSGPKDAILELIAGVTRIPKRKLVGTERGDLASSQDEAAFVAMIEERRRKFAEPQILRPLINKLREFGVLDDPEDDSYDVEWPDLFELTEVEQAEVMQRKARALKDAASQGDPAELGTLAERRDFVFGWDPERGGEVDDVPPDPGPSPVDDPTADLPDDSEDNPTDVDVDDPLDEDDPEVEDVFEDITETDVDDLLDQAGEPTASTAD